MSCASETPWPGRSEFEQHGNVAAYVFSGSHPGLMQRSQLANTNPMNRDATAAPVRR